MSPEKGRVVYSSDKGRLCPRCGWPTEDCHCAVSLGAPDEPVPEKITAKLRIEHRGSGKSVTVVDGLPKNAPFLDTLLMDLKRSCGAGGRVAEGNIELQGDQRDRLRDLLARKGWSVKG